jgi:predicted ATP-dependent protease
MAKGEAVATELGGFAFGRPARITCQVPRWSGKVVDIEREVELGGPFDSKGLRILACHLVDALKANPS